jgi:hypothetical protein
MKGQEAARKLIPENPFSGCQEERERSGESLMDGLKKFIMVVNKTNVFVGKLMVW